jgi:hypothetical protein
VPKMLGVPKVSHLAIIPDKKIIQKLTFDTVLQKKHPIKLTFISCPKMLINNNFSSL